MKIINISFILAILATLLISISVQIKTKPSKNQIRNSLQAFCAIAEPADRIMRQANAAIEAANQKLIATGERPIRATGHANTSCNSSEQAVEDQYGSAMARWYKRVTSKAAIAMLYVLAAYLIATIAYAIVQNNKQPR